MTLQVYAIPVCLLAGTFRFLPFGDFQAQFFHGVLIELFTVTFPYIAVICVHASERKGMFFFGLFGVIVHVTSFFFSLKHVHAA